MGFVCVIVALVLFVLAALGVGVPPRAERVPSGRRASYFSAAGCCWG